MVAVEMARWPAALEPWLNAATRERALPPAWASACVKAQAPEAGLKIVSIANGETIRRAGSVSDAAPPELRLEARGSQSELIWLISGVQVGRSRAGKSLRHRFAEPGRYTITAMDESGRYDRVEISLR